MLIIRTVFYLRFILTKSLIMNVTYFACLAIFFPSVLLSQPELKILEESYTFDTITKGDLCKHDFLIVNSGNEPLIISNTKTSCGCDVASWPKEPIMPNDTSIITYKYDSNRVGPFKKSMTISSNDKLPYRVVRISGVILPEDETSR